MKEKAWFIVFIIVKMLIVVNIVNADELAYPWPKGNTFEISKITDLKETYKAGEQIVVYVEGQSSINIQPSPNEGFHVQAYMLLPPNNTTIAGTNGEYDEDLRAWVIRLSTQKKMTKPTEYLLHISLYCADSLPQSSDIRHNNSVINCRPPAFKEVPEGPCEVKFGRAAQTDKIVSFIVGQDL